MPREDPKQVRIRYPEAGAGSTLLVFHPLVACTLAGLAAGLLAFAAGEATYDTFEAGWGTRQAPRAATAPPSAEARDGAMMKNAALAGAPLGALSGLFLGLAGGLLRGDSRRGLVGGGVGLALGGLVGGLAPLGLHRLAFELQDRYMVDTLLAGTAAQTAVAGLIAAVAGAGFGLALGGVRTVPRFAALALLGGVAGALIYATVGAAVFPLAETDRALATERTPRLLAHLLVALGAGAGLGLGLTGRRRRSRRREWEEPHKPDDADPAGAPDAPPVTPGAS
ncbi:hypothetical protein [Paludisphaera soli]|uniref:hypothetical protein n=1 Tax=Paludisphaera soli TaxID=2712865 RepID=UPI0013EADE6A|nr:hypothetical protein [Paludisphaera soli]